MQALRRYVLCEDDAGTFVRKALFPTDAIDDTAAAPSPARNFTVTAEPKDKKINKTTAEAACLESVLININTPATLDLMNKFDLHLGRDFGFIYRPLEKLPSHVNSAGKAMWSYASRCRQPLIVPSPHQASAFPTRSICRVAGRL